MWVDGSTFFFFAYGRVFFLRAAENEAAGRHTATTA